MKDLTLGDVVGSASWEMGADGVWRGHVHCSERRCHNMASFPVQNPPPSQRSWPRDAAFEAARKAAQDEYHAHPIPAGWIVVVTDRPRLYCSPRCGRLALAKLEKAKA